MPDQGPKRILIVDDEPTLRLLANRALTLDGHECVEAADGASARAILSEQREIALMVSDINMPGESGIDLVRWVIAAHPEIAILMATGVDDRSMADEAIALGVHGYLIKPFELNELRITVANALRRQGLERAQEARSEELERLVAQRTAALEQSASTLRDNENRLRSLVSSAPVGVLYANLDGVCEYVNEAAGEISGHDSERLLGHGFLEVVHPDDFERVLRHLRLASKRNAPASIEHRLRQADGRETIALTRVAPVLDDSGLATAVVAIIEDVTEQRRFERELAHRATHDELTGLPNRQLLLDRIGQAVESGACTVLMIDLDRFKLVNDIHGHTAGDQLLIEAASVLAAEFTAGETVARFGGDEFVVVCHTNSESEVSDAAERALSTLAELATVNRRGVAISASIGIASADPTSTAEDLLRHSDIAMYRAKERGGSRYEVFDERLGQLIQERVRVEGDLREAIDRDQLEVHYQPQVDSNDCRLRRVEALVRWRHPARGLLPPAAFLSVASEVGLMEDLTDVVLTHACRQALEWTRLTPDREPVPISVNIGASELEADRLSSRVREILASVGFDPSFLTLEVTEESLINDLDRSALHLDALRELGIRTSLDDFGTGYSSLSYLSRLPLDELKIDRTFVQRIGETQPTPDVTPPDLQLVEAIIRLASIFELEVVAEGIENLHELETLRSLGCTTAQGFHIGRPTLPNDPALLALIAGSQFHATAHGA